VVRVIDLTALCESLTHDELPDDVVSELLDLIQATIEDGDPRLTSCFLEFKIRNVNLWAVVKNRKCSFP
jgi:hypothetical protein